MDRQIKSQASIIQDRLAAAIQILNGEVPGSIENALMYIRAAFEFSKSLNEVIAVCEAEEKTSQSKQYDWREIYLRIRRILSDRVSDEPGIPYTLLDGETTVAIDPLNWIEAKSQDGTVLFHAHPKRGAIVFVYGDWIKYL